MSLFYFLIRIVELYTNSRKGEITADGSRVRNSDYRDSFG